MRLDEKLKVIYETIAPAVTRSEEAWKAYLRFASAIYKQPFDNALLVYAQNPKATMLATTAVWNSPKAGRYVNKGEKGIAVCEYGNAGLTLRYLFDVTQTNGREIPPPWTLGGWLGKGVLSRLTYSHGLTAGGITECIGQMVDSAVADKADGFMRNFAGDIKGHFLGSLPEEGLAVEVEELVAQSSRYFIASRCGTETDGIKMPTISHFDTIPLISRLGHAVTELSKGILLEISRNVTILESERSAEDEQWTIRQQRTAGTIGRLTAGEPDAGRGTASRQVRPDGNEAPPWDRPPKVFTFEDAGEAPWPDAQGGQGVGGEGRGTDTETAGTGPGPEDRRPHGAGAPPEPTEGHGGGTRDPRNGADTEVTGPEPEKEPKGSFSMPTLDDEGIIKAELLSGSMLLYGGKNRIYSFAKTGPKTAALAKALKEEYGWGGHTGSGRVRFVACDSSGIQFDLRDGTAENGGRSLKLSWNEVARRILALVDSGEYLSDIRKPAQGGDPADMADGEGMAGHHSGSELPEPETDKWANGYAIPDAPESYGQNADGQLSFDLSGSHVGMDLGQKEPMPGPKTHKGASTQGMAATPEETLPDTDGKIQTRLPGQGMADDPEKELPGANEKENGNKKEASPRLENKLLDTHHHQLDLQIQAFMGTYPAGFLDYSVYGGRPSISLIEVGEGYRRQGIGTAMVQYLAGRFPGIEIEWGMLTDDGAAFRKAVTYTVENEEYKETVSRITEIEGQLARYETQYAEKYVPHDDAVRWNALTDEIYDLENRLAELNPVNTFVKPHREEAGRQPGPDMDVSGGMVEISAPPKITALPDADATSGMAVLPDADATSGIAALPDGGAMPEMAALPDGGAMPEMPAPSNTTAMPKIKPLPQAAAAPDKSNYRYSEADSLFSGGPKAKFRNNIEAIRLMKSLEAERRAATPAEQKVLANYVGWGGLANAFSRTAAGWENEYQELRLMLDGDEYKAAMNSTITAFYTEPKIARAMYQALSRFGFAGGKNRTLLEPALGTGIFFSVLPDGWQGTKLCGIELDSVTGRIARQLYQDAEIQVKGFETARFEDDSIDAIVGNIPFNSIKVYDKRYEEEKFLIHDYFIAKSLDLLKPGGIMAVITSKGTMDKADISAREYFARRADLIGAVRLPNSAFKELSGTEVTADILFFQKLEQARKTDKFGLPDWVYTDIFPRHRFRANQYFIDNPHMILGEMKDGYWMHGNTDGSACVAPEGQDFPAELDKALGRLSAVFTARPDPEVTALSLSIDSAGTPGEERVKADEGTKNYTYVVKDGKIYFNENGCLIPQDFKGVKAGRVRGLCGIRSALLDVIGIQSREGGYQHGELEEAQKKLNEVYDAFVGKYGFINDKANSAVWGNDDQYPLLRSVEDLNEDKATYSKAPIFTKATIRPCRQPTHAESAKEALEISLNMKLKVDLAYMAYLYERTEEEIIAELGDRIYLNPKNYYGNPYEGWETAEEYLSGDVVSKWDYARLKAEDNELFARNVAALEAVQPARLLPADIDFRIGSPWIPIGYHRQFMYEAFETPEHLKAKNGPSQGRIELEYLEYTDTWRVSNIKNGPESVKVHQTYGTGRANAYEIYEDCLNLQSVTVRDPVKYYDTNGKEQTKYVINANETMIARSKQQQIKEAFADWLFADNDRAETLLAIYNERFNRIRPREYDGSHLRFDGLNEEREFRKSQLDAVARIVYLGTCLMAHEVGAGKTAAMVAAGMYMRNMGVIKKPIYVVPNHLTEQWAGEFMRFFPSASILVATKADFERKNRRRFISKIATGDYDAIIIGHSQFERIPISRERQERLLNEEIATLTRIIEQMKAEKGESWAIKQTVIFQNSLKDRLERLTKEERKDDLLNFEQLGVDYMFVDEAHMYKNCYIYTKMRNVAGIGQSRSQRASDMLMKCQYLQETNKGRGVTFATGTPISNSMSELYVMQRFLQPEALKKTGLHFFDKWAATFGDTVSSLEINPEGSGYRIKNRFSKFHNLPELMNMFRVVADIQTGDMLNLPVPKIDGGKAQIVITERSQFQKKIMEGFVERAEAIRSRKAKPEEDNMLKLTNEARLMAIDPRLVYPDAPNDPDSKLNTCIRNVFGIWRDTAGGRLAQVVFCDSGTPKPGKFNVYDEMKGQLTQMGVPAEEIAFVHDAKTDAQREEMFEKTRKGEVRVLIGSTGKLGTGTNIQTKLYALHHLDVPWRPSDIIQRDGRGIRFGNENGTVKIFRYVTKDTFDAYLWQIQEQKLRYITQVMTSKSVSRSCEDVDETVLTAAEIKAIATSNPLLAEKMSVDNEVARLKLLKGNWANERLVLERKISTSYPAAISQTQGRIENIKWDIAVLEQHKGGDFMICIGGKTYSGRPAAGEALLAAVRARCAVGEEQHIGSYRGLDLYGECKNIYETRLRLMGRARYHTPIGDSAIGCITRIENLAERLPDFMSEAETKLSETEHQLEAAKQAVTKPFAYEEKLSGLLARQSEINTTLEFKELSKQQDEVLSEGGADDGAGVGDEYENDGIAV